MAKQIFEVEHNGQLYEVEADSPEQAASAFAPQQAAPEAPVQQTIVPEQEAATYPGQDKEWGDYGWGDVLETTWDAATMMGTSIIAQPVSGLAGMATHSIHQLFNGDPAKANEAAAKVQSFTEGLLTNDPEAEPIFKAVGEAGELFEKVTGKTPEQVSNKVDDAIYFAARGNPEFAAIIKTTLYGIPSIVGLNRLKIPAHMRARAEYKAGLQRVAKEAEEEGLPMDAMRLPGAVTEKARVLAPNAEKGGGFDEILAELQTARKAAHAEVDAAWDAFRASDAFLNVSVAKGAAQNIRRELANEGHIVNKGITQEILQDLSRLDRREVNTGRKFKGDKKRAEVALRELDVVRRKITNNIRGDKAKGVPYTPEDRALLSVRDKLDSMIEDQFIAGAISGDPNVHNLWKQARGLSAQYNANFNADSTIRKMLVDGVSAEQAYNFLIGASAMGAKDASIHTIRRMKQILGPTNPVLTNMRNAAVRDVLLPLLPEAGRPNFNLAISNIDKLLKNHPKLVEELDINPQDLVRLRRAAFVASETVNMLPEKFSAEYITGIAASVAFGHGIARKGAIVRTARKFMNKAFDVGIMSPSEIRRHLLAADYDTPMIAYDTPSLTMWAAMSGAAAESSDADAKERNRAR